MHRIARALVATVAVIFGSTVLAATSAAPSSAVAWTPPSDAEIRKILVDRIDVQHQGVGIVVGIIDKNGRRIISYGVSNQGDPRAVDGDTVFEIGSMTKVFTALLLSQMVQRGDLSLTDPASKYLPAGVTLPERGGKQIELIDLATHTSGLPGMPSDFYPIKNEANPYVDYTIDQMNKFLNSYKLDRDIGAKFEYSNLGFAVLGHIVTREAGMDYETLVRERITAPLNMRDTSIALSPSMKARLAVGHDEHMQPTPNWDLPAFEGAGALRSTANDILTFLGAELGYIDTPLSTAMKAELAPRRPRIESGWFSALAWGVYETPNQEVFFKNGGTGGYRTSMGFDPKAGVGVVVLTNSVTPSGGDDINLHILTGSPLEGPPAAH